MTKQLSPRQLATALDVSESSVRRWIDAGALASSRTEGGHRRVSVNEAIGYVRRNGLALVRPELLGVQDDGGPECFSEALFEGDARRAEDALVAAYLAGRSVAAICDDWIAPAMAAVGRAWRKGLDGVLTEHRATAICVEALHRLRQLAPRPGRLTAAGGAAPDDGYAVPTTMAALVLTMEGARAIDLGPRTPVSVLGDAARAHGVDLAWVSVSELGPRGAGPLARDLHHLAGELAERGAHLVVGGREAGRLGLASTDNLLVAERMTELAALARGLAT